MATTPHCGSVLHKILRADACFTRDGVLRAHNNHLWSRDSHKMLSVNKGALWGRCAAVVEGECISQCGLDVEGRLHGRLSLRIFLVDFFTVGTPEGARLCTPSQDFEEKSVSWLVKCTLKYFRILLLLNAFTKIVRDEILHVFSVQLTAL
jgi:hypothetical protein